VEGKSFHKNCFRCTHCNNPLKPGNYASLQGTSPLLEFFLLLIIIIASPGKPYCKPHFKQLFQLKGNYSSGFGELTPEQAWKSKNDAPAAATIPTIPATKDEPKGKGKAASSGAASSSASITVTPPASASAASVRAVAVEIATHPPAKIYDDTVLRLARDFPGTPPTPSHFSIFSPPRSSSFFATFVFRNVGSSNNYVDKYYCFQDCLPFFFSMNCAPARPVR
jgi:hypothetical protein